jgi:hypothetical protein
LDAYENSVEFQSQIDSLLSEMIAAEEGWRNTELGELIYDNFTRGLSSGENADWQAELSSKIGAAASWGETPWGKKTADIETAIKNLPD